MSIRRIPQATNVVGAQWGDEGKGKLVHWLAQSFQWVIRYQGGENAGHTVKTDGQTHRFRLLPSGILYPHLTAVLARGMVVNPISLATEINELVAQGAFRGKLIVDRGIPLVLRVHQLQDQYSEEVKSATGQAVGTTRRGIGPAYADSHFRVGLRVGDLLLPRSELRRLFGDVIARKNALFTGYYGKPPVDVDQEWAEFEPSIGEVAVYIKDAVASVLRAKARGETFLCEGAQGALLDLYYGTYPYVTSSHPGVSGALSGTGINWTDIGDVIGVTKAYCTRVGNGSFPTEAKDRLGDSLRERGAEYGTVTNRPRRCGWLDLSLLDHVQQIIGITKWAVTKVDVLDDLPEIPVGRAYSLEGGDPARIVASVEMDQLGRYVPRYDYLPGWQCDTTQCRNPGDLPEALVGYLDMIEAATRTPVGWVSVGPDSDATIKM